MNTHEGLRRARVLANRLTLFGPMAGAALWIVAFLVSGRWGFGELIVLVGFPAVIGAVLLHQGGPVRVVFFMGQNAIYVTCDDCGLPILGRVHVDPPESVSGL